MSTVEPQADVHRPDAHRQTVWLLLAPLTIWAVHFLLAYITAAIWYAKSPPDTSRTTLHTTIAVYTTLALAGIAVLAWSAWRRLHVAAPAVASTATHTAARDSFTGRLQAMLAGLSAVAVLFTQIAVTLGSRA